MFPESIYIRDYGGYLPIHFVICSYHGRDRSQILRFLLECCPDSASEPIESADVDSWGDPDAEGCLALHLACIRKLNLDYLKMIFNAYPEAINIKDGQGKIPSDYLLVDYPLRRSFMSRQLENAATAKDGRVKTVDELGRLPLHTALSDTYECLGGIKLLVKGYSDALLRQSGCLDGGSFYYGFYPLHIACKRGLLDIVKYLMNEQASVVSKRTQNGKLPFHLLCASGNGSPEYLDAIWNLLMAYPEAVASKAPTRLLRGPVLCRRSSLVTQSVLTSFYKQYNPDKVCDADTIITQYIGREFQLLAKLFSKYKVEDLVILEERYRSCHLDRLYSIPAAHRLRHLALEGLDMIDKTVSWEEEEEEASFVLRRTRHAWEASFICHVNVVTKV